MERTSGYLLKLRTIGREAFVAAYPCGFFLSTREPDGGSDADEFHTGQINGDMARLAGQLNPDQARSVSRADGLQVLAVTKAPGNPFRERVSIGRARNTDVVIPDGSMSKLHAHINTSPEGPTLTDVGSRNGTLVNGERLAPKTPVVLHPGCQIRFGNVDLTYHTADSFAAYLEALTETA